MGDEVVAEDDVRCRFLDAIGIFRFLILLQSLQMFPTPLLQRNLQILNLNIAIHLHHIHKLHYGEQPKGTIGSQPHN